MKEIWMKSLECTGKAEVSWCTRLHFGDKVVRNWDKDGLDADLR